MIKNIVQIKLNLKKNYENIAGHPVIRRQYETLSTRNFLPPFFFWSCNVL